MSPLLLILIHPMYLWRSTEYQAEVSWLMDLIVNNLYSNKEGFLRELISNASDSLDKLRFLSVTAPELMEGALELDIRIQTDQENGIITLTDSGIGMTHEELVDSLGTIAHSETAKFLVNLVSDFIQLSWLLIRWSSQQKVPNLISNMFGKGRPIPAHTSFERRLILRS